MLARSTLPRALYHHRIPPHEKSWLTRKVETSPTALKVFTHLTNALGYGSPKQVAGRRGFVLYGHVCAVKPDQDAAFWQQECSLPPTFQSWFTITNLHIWLLTVRLRSLPPPHGKFYTQALVDHFFIDIEDRIRARARIRAPDRLVTRQMKIFKEQWAGMGLAFDLALVQGDMDMAGAVWRNLLGARGARGISLPAGEFRRSVNLVGGEVVNVAKVDIEAEEARDDGSGVYDFPPEESERYVHYPELMLDIVGYVRRELVRLEAIKDKQIMSGSLEGIKFGKVR
ncbi:ubiquinol-cytochrome C chaperone-domain-containing protein [Infundibulicybe gibba]|nr:ubiquinol-cytochrome C chaperone-domain-containing protein [Infundibulicybe gibba]